MEWHQLSAICWEFRFWFRNTFHFIHHSLTWESQKIKGQKVNKFCLLPKARFSLLLSLLQYASLLMNFLMKTVYVMTIFCSLKEQEHVCMPLSSRSCSMNEMWRTRLPWSLRSCTILLILRLKWLSTCSFLISIKTKWRKN